MQPRKNILKVHTILRAGTECLPWDTNCVGFNPGGWKVYDTCLDGHPFAGAECHDRVNEEKVYNGYGQQILGTCLRC
jgi:hypothetical protein